MNEKEEQVTHDPKSLPTTPRLASLGFRGDLRYELLIRPPQVFVKIRGKQHHFWRAVDQDGEVVDVFLQSRRDGKAAVRFFKRLLRVSDSEPR